MANEIPTVKVLGRSRLQGGGKTLGGVAKNHKEEVWGELTGTYVTSGAAFVARDVGLTGFDKLNLSVISVNGGTELTATTTVSADYSEADSKILMATADINGARTAAVNGQAYICNFHAIGDSARNPELT